MLPAPKFEITIDENNLENGVHELLKHLKPSWNTKDVKINLFTDGITNKLCCAYISSNPDDVVLIRVYGKNTDLFIDRNAEVKNMQFLHSVGCAPKIFAVFQNGLSYEFLPGVALSNYEVCQEDMSRLIAQRFSKLHSITPSGDEEQKPCVFKMLRKFLNLLPDSFEDPHMNKKYLDGTFGKNWFEGEIKLLEEHLPKLDSPIVFCHNDVLSKNVIYDKNLDTVHFIDFEYGGYNYQAYDIANHFCEFAGVDPLDYSMYPNEIKQKKWLQYYLQCWYKELGSNDTNISDLDVQKLYVQVNQFALASHMLWILWSFIQAKYSSIDFHFLDYGIQRLGEYMKRKGEFLGLTF